MPHTLREKPDLDSPRITMIGLDHNGRGCSASRNNRLSLHVRRILSWSDRVKSRRSNVQPHLNCILASTMNKYLPIVLIVIGLILGIFGFTKLDDSGASLSVGELEVAATDEGGRTQAYVLIGLGAVGVLAGVGMMVKSKS